MRQGQHPTTMTSVILDAMNRFSFRHSGKILNFLLVFCLVLIFRHYKFGANGGELAGLLMAYTTYFGTRAVARRAHNVDHEDEYETKTPQWEKVSDIIGLILAINIFFMVPLIYLLTEQILWFLMIIALSIFLLSLPRTYWRGCLFLITR